MAVLLWCHGGCFTGGSVDNDQKLRSYLTSHNICQCIPIDFSLKSWHLAIRDIYRYALSDFQGRKVVLGGISSGAMMAHHVANKLKLPAVLICPVLKPADRHQSLSNDLQERQLKFFGSLEEMANIQDSIAPPNNLRYILYGTKDVRAPVSGFEKWLEGDRCIVDVLDKGHEMCSDPPCELIAQGIAKLLN